MLDISPHPSPPVARVRIDAAGGDVRIVVMTEVDGEVVPVPVTVDGHPLTFSALTWKRLRFEGDRAAAAAEMETPRRQRELTREGGR